MSSASDCYDSPRYWNLAFSDETIPEADFIEAAAAKYSSISVRRVLEPACGGGRQVVELAARGYSVTAFDLNLTAIEYARILLKRRRLRARVFSADMRQFVLDEPCDLAHCLVNSFRHLLTDADAEQHLRSVASALRPGGLYLLGLHLIPPDAEEYDCERWTVTRRGTRVTTTVRVIEFDRRRRLETVRFSLCVRSAERCLRMKSDYRLRIYRADQMRSLLKRVPQLKLLAVHDFCYDVRQPLRLNNELGDTVLVLQRAANH